MASGLSLSTGPSFSKVGHSSICGKTHATNRLLGQNEIYHNGETLVRNTSMRSPVHVTGDFIPKQGVPSPSLKNDEVWSIDTAPIARGSEFDVYPSSFESPYCIEPNGGAGATGDGKPGRRSIDSEVLAQKRREKFGGSFDREKKYTQYVSLLDETQTVNSTGSPFEAPRKAGFVQYRISDLTLPGPGTYSPHIPYDTLKLPHGATEVGADSTLSKARKAKLGLPKEQWEGEPTTYEPPRKMKEGNLGGCGDRWTVGTSDGHITREISFPFESISTGRYISEAFPPSHLVAAGWNSSSLQATFGKAERGGKKGGNQNNHKNSHASKKSNSKHFDSLSKAGLGGMGGLAPRNTHKSNMGGSLTHLSQNASFTPLENVAGCFSGPELLRRSSSRFMPEKSPLGSGYSHNFSSEEARNFPPRHHHLAICHQSVKMEGYEKLKQLEEKLKSKNADQIWGKGSRDIDVRDHMNRYKFGQQERFKVKPVEEPLVVDKDETAMYHFDSKKHENFKNITQDPTSLKELKIIAKTKSKPELEEFKLLLKHRKSVDDALKQLIAKEKAEEEAEEGSLNFEKEGGKKRTQSHEYGSAETSNEYGEEDEEYDDYDEDTALNDKMATKNSYKQTNDDGVISGGITSQDLALELKPPGQPPSLPPMLPLPS